MCCVLAQCYNNFATIKDFYYICFVVRKSSPTFNFLNIYIYG